MYQRHTGGIPAPILKLAGSLTPLSSEIKNNQLLVRPRPIAAILSIQLTIHRRPPAIQANEQGPNQRTTPGIDRCDQCRCRSDCWRRNSCAGGNSFRSDWSGRHAGFRVERSDRFTNRVEFCRDGFAVSGIRWHVHVLSQSHVGGSRVFRWLGRLLCIDRCCGPVCAWSCPLRDRISQQHTVGSSSRLTI